MRGAGRGQPRRTGPVALGLTVLGILVAAAAAPAAAAERSEPTLLVSVAPAGGESRPTASARVVCLFFTEEGPAGGAITDCFPVSLPPIELDVSAGESPPRGARVLSAGGWVGSPGTAPGLVPAPLAVTTQPVPPSFTAAPVGPTEVAIEADVEVVPEGFGSLSLSVRRYCPVEECAMPAATVDYSTVAGSAEAGADFTPASGVLSWAVDELSSRTVSIDILDDQVHEPDVESFSVVLGSQQGTDLAPGLDRFFIEIVDDDPPIGPSPDPTELFLDLEADVVPEGVGSIRVRARRECTGQPCSIGPATVEYATEESGSALADRDYRSVSGSWSWGADDLGTRSFVVPITDDNRHEPDIESFRVVLRNPTGAAIRPGGGEAFIEIVDDDPAVGSLRFAASEFLVGEAAGAATVRVLREGGSEGRASVTVSAAPGSAELDADFGAVSPDTLIWADGEAGEKTVSVAIEPDGELEANETVMLTLGDAVGAELGAPATAVLTIIDNKEVPGRLDFTPGSREKLGKGLEEGDRRVLAVKRSEGSSGEVRVGIVVGGAAERVVLQEAGDCSGTELSWRDGETGPREFTLQIKDDEAAQDKGTATLTLEECPGPAVILGPDLPVIIRESDQPFRMLPWPRNEPTERRALPGDEVELGVRIVDEEPPEGSGVVGEVVSWEITSGSDLAALARRSCDGRREGDKTDQNGVAWACVRPEKEGSIVVVASSGGLEPVEFSIASGLPPEDPEDPVLDDDEAPVALALFGAETTPVGGEPGFGGPKGVCLATEVSAELRQVCAELRRLYGSSQEEPRPWKQAFDALSIDDHASQADSSRNAGASQKANLLARMASIKSGAIGIGIEQLALDIRGERLSGQVVASLLRPGGNGGIEALARNRILPYPGPWELSEPGLGELPSARDLMGLLAPHGDHGADPFDLESLLAVEDPPGATAGEATGATADQRFTRKLRLFVNGTIALGERPSTDTDTGYDFETAGLSFGADYRLSDSLFVGSALGYVSSDSELTNSSRVETEGTSLGLFALYLPTAHLAVDGIAIYGRNRLEMDRFVDFPGRPARVRGSPDGDQISLGLGLAYDGSLGAWYLNGFGRLSYLEATVEAYEERGAVETTGYELRIGAQELTSLVSRVGLDLSYAASNRTPALLPGLSVSYLHEFEDGSRVLTASFIGDLRASPATFAIPTESPDRDYFSAGVSLQALFACDRQLWLAYERDLERADLDLYTLRAGFKFALGGCKKAILPPSGGPGSGGGSTTGE